MDFCNYCGSDNVTCIRPVGFTEHEEKRLPLIKDWCGVCETDDEVSLEATLVVCGEVNNDTGTGD